MEVMIFCGGVKGPCNEGNPIRKKAIANLIRQRVSLLTYSRSIENSHRPRQSQHPNRRPHTEQDVPSERRDKEDSSDDVKVSVGLGVVSGQQSQLERRLE
jgi:hypothetical protein